MSVGLKIEIMSVYKDAEEVLHLDFHHGVNIIRGDNGTGKSTIIELMTFALGADIHDFHSQQLACDVVFLELRIREQPYTVKREIDKGRPPIAFAEGELSETLGSATEWLTFGYIRSEQRMSFSEQFFSLMGLPQHTTETNNNLTMHQLLRLLYVDQMTETGELLNHESQFDRGTLRRAIGEYLLGIDDLEAHELRQKLRTTERKYESIEGELRAIYRILGSTVDEFNRERLLESIEERKNEIDKLEQQLSEQLLLSDDELSEENKKSLDELTQQLKELTEKKLELVDQSEATKEERLDSMLFLDSLEEKVRAIEQSSEAKQWFVDADFKYCPACLQPLTETEEAHCPVCKEPITEEEFAGGHIRAITELNFQQKETQRLLVGLEQRMSSLQNERTQLDLELAKLKSQYRSIEGSGRADSGVLSRINREIGFAQNDLSRLENQLTSIDNVTSLQRQKDELQREISSIESQIEQLEYATAERAEFVYRGIESIAKDLLERDGGWEDEFSDAQEVTIDFERNSMWVDGKSRFSASSRVIMKNSIRIAIFLQGLTDSDSRMPSLLIIDNMEDQGMQQERSQNFQKVLVERCGDLDNQFQIIFTTSMVAPELKDSTFGVGPFYEKGTHSLEI